MNSFTSAAFAFLVLLAVILFPRAALTAPVTAPASQPTPLTRGTHLRSLQVDGRQRSYLVHLPAHYDAEHATPVVLAFHGAYMNAVMMEAFTGLNQKADQAGFIVIYPNGVGFGDAMLFFNAWADPKPDGPPDDVKFTAMLLDDLQTMAHVDKQRVFATGMSNGGMMCHRLGAELSDRIAAIAPVAGTVALPDFAPKHPVPVIEFHGTADAIVPFDGLPRRGAPFVRFSNVEQSIIAWVKADECPPKPKVTQFGALPTEGMSVKQKTYGPGKDGSEVVLVIIENGGHTWPGRKSPVKFLGKTTLGISANDLIWDFFQKHPKK